MRHKRLLSVVLIFALLFSVAGCGSSAIYTPGTYEGSAQGFGGTINVKVKVDETKILEVEAVGNDETEGVGTKAIDELPSKIVEANSTDVDVVAGATYSSNGIIDAVESALSQAKGEEITAQIVDGKYVVESIGHEGTVVVCTTIIDESIKSVKVLNHDETQGIGTYAIARVPAWIVEEQSINVDVVSGATVTSNVIKLAVGEAITQAGGNVSDFSKEAAKVETVENEVEEDVQVAIMGAGTAGLFAAARLLEQGVEDVILFEKQDIPGGCMPATYGGIVLAGSEIYNNWGLGSPFYSSWDNMQAAYQAYLDASGREYNTDMPYVGAMFRKSGEMYDWMASIGIGFTTLGSRTGYTYPYFSPGPYEGGSGYAMEFLVDRIEQKGGRIIYATPVTDLIQDESGNITGLIAEGEDGTTWKVNADAVVLASGSFARNEELIDEYFPEWSGHYFNTIESVTGDGLVLGMKYGAGIEDMGAEVPGFMASYDSHFELAFMHMTVPGIIVNIDGNEFGNIIRLNHQVMSQAKADPANGDTFYYIFDEAAAYQARHSETYGFDTYKAIFEKGEAVHYDSLEECATALNLPNLAETVGVNNNLALNEEANEWGRDNLPYIDTKDGVWAIRVDPNVYLTTGGLKIDLSCHVLTEEGEIIPGLYAAGDVVGSIEQKDGLTYGYGFDSAMAFGSIAADTIASQVK